MSMIYRFFVVVIAAASLLLGAQAPNFVDQYEKRLGMSGVRPSILIGARM